MMLAWIRKIGRATSWSKMQEPLVGSWVVEYDVAALESVGGS